MQDVTKAMRDELVRGVLARSTRGKIHAHECPDRESLDGIVAKILAE